MNFSRVTIPEFVEITDEDSVKILLSEFSCDKNKEIEDFVRNKALDFSKRKITITHLLLDEESNLVAIYALTHKAITINGNLLNESVLKKLRKYALPEPNTNNFLVSAFLIAQFGKNSSNKNCKQRIGNEIMQSVFEFIKKVQNQIGGRIIYLECEDKKELLDFYTNEQNRFSIFGERFSEDGILYKQLLKIL